MTDRRVLRYEVPVDDQWHRIRCPGEVRHVAARQVDVVEFWAVTGPWIGRGVDREFRVYATGQPIPASRVRGLWYEGGAITPDGALVWHLFSRSAVGEGDQT